jgi:hypothetical protein
MVDVRQVELQIDPSSISPIIPAKNPMQRAYRQLKVEATTWFRRRIGQISGLRFHPRVKRIFYAYRQKLFALDKKLIE